MKEAAFRAADKPDVCLASLCWGKVSVIYDPGIVTVVPRLGV